MYLRSIEEWQALAVARHWQFSVSSRVSVVVGKTVAKKRWIEHSFRELIVPSSIVTVFSLQTGLIVSLHVRIKVLIQAVTMSSLAADHDFIHRHLIVKVFVVGVKIVLLLVTFVEKVDLLNVKLRWTVNAATTQVRHRPLRQNSRFAILREGILAVVHHREEVVGEAVICQVVVSVLLKVPLCSCKKIKIKIA